MKGLEVGDAAYIKGEITEVNPNGTYTVEFSSTVHTPLGDSSGLLAMMIPTEDVVPRGPKVEQNLVDLMYAHQNPEVVLLLSNTKRKEDTYRCECGFTLGQVSERDAWKLLAQHQAAMVKQWMELVR